MATTRGERLRAAREKIFRSARSAATALGMPHATYGAHERAEAPGGRDYGPDEARRYARRFRVTPEWLLTGADGMATVPTEPQSEIVLVPVVSSVSAGALVDTESQIPVDDDTRRLPFNDLGPGDFFALLVEGDSMDLVSPEGSIIVVNRNDRDLVEGRFYVFISGRETTFKQWQADPPRLEPCSTNRAHKSRFIKGKKDFAVVGRVRRTVLDL